MALYVSLSNILLQLYIKQYPLSRLFNVGALLTFTLTGPYDSLLDTLLNLFFFRTNHPLPVFLGRIILNLLFEGDDCFVYDTYGNPIYTGTISVTVSGIPCQRWDSTTTHDPNYPML